MKYAIIDALKWIGNGILNAAAIGILLLICVIAAATWIVWTCVCLLFTAIVAPVALLYDLARRFIENRNENDHNENNC